MMEMIEISKFFDENEGSYENFGEYFYWKHDEAAYFCEHAKAWRGENESKIEFSDGWKVVIGSRGPFTGAELIDNEGKKTDEIALVETNLDAFLEKMEEWCLDHVMKMMTEEKILG